MIDTGFSYEKECDHLHMEYSDPTVAENANIDNCSRLIHQVRHDIKIAIFCDGAFDSTPPVNTTVHVIDQTSLEGAHHGVAIPVDDGHLLHSTALQERINWNPNATSLPSTFKLDDTSNPDTHCAGFHGGVSVGNTFMLACDDIHGGFVRVIVSFYTDAN